MVVFVLCMRALFFKEDKLGVVVHAINPSTWEAKTGGSVKLLSQETNKNFKDGLGLGGQVKWISG